MGKSIGKIISKHLNGKYGQKFLDHAKKSDKDSIKKSDSKNSISNWCFN